MKKALATLGVAPGRIHIKMFNGGESMTPGVVGAATRTPHLPTDDANTGPLVSFARSGVAAHWKGSVYQSILELAEACDVPVRWSCRTGVCHSCESGLVSGTVVYGPEPLEKPAEGDLLVCCSQPTRDIVIDLWFDRSICEKDRSFTVAVPEGPSRPTARDIWPQVEDQGAAYQSEAETRRYERNRHSGREARKDNE